MRAINRLLLGLLGGQGASAPAPNPVNVIEPSITYSAAKVGVEMTIDLGVWVYATALYAELRHSSDGTVVATYTDDGTYTPDVDDIDETLYLIVTPDNNAAFAVETDATDIIEADTPAVVTPPALPVETFYIGDLSSAATAASWDVTPDTTEHKWQRLIAGTWTDISSTNSLQYTPTNGTPGDFGNYLRIGERAQKDSVWSSWAYSDPTDDVVWSHQAVTYGSTKVSNGGMETGDPPTGWSGNATTPASQAEERTGGAGSASMKIAGTGAGNFPYGYQALSLDAGKMYAHEVWMRREDSTSVTASVTHAVPATGMTADTSTTWKRKRAVFHHDDGSAAQTRNQATVSASGQYGLFDDISTVEIVQTADQVAPSSNMTVKLYYTLNATYIEGDELALEFRKQDYKNKFIARLYRNNTPNQWHLRLLVEIAGVQSILLTQTNVGTSNGIYINAYSDQITVYLTTDGGATWSAIGSPVTNANFETETGVNAYCHANNTLGDMQYADGVNPYDGSTSGWFADASGSAIAVGSAADPFSIERGLTAVGVIQPDDTLYLSGHWQPTAKTQNITIGGTSGHPITITPKAGEIFRFDCGITPTAAHLIIDGDYRMIQECPGVAHETAQSGTTTPPTDIRSYIGIYVNSVDDVKVINVRQDGLTWTPQEWFGNIDGEFYGNVTSNCGVIAPDREHGPGQYGNKGAANTRRFENMLYLNSFRYTPQYTTTDTMTFKNFVVFGVGSYIGSSLGVDNITYDGAWFLSAYPFLGFYGDGNNGALHMDNCVVDPKRAGLNPVYAAMFDQWDSILTENGKYTVAAYVNNEKVGGSYTIDIGTPYTGTTYKFIINEYNADFASFWFLDTTESGSITIDVSLFATDGETIRVHNPMKWDSTDYGDEYADLVVSGGNITLTTTGWTTPAPYGLGAAYPDPVVFSARSGAFIFENLG